MTCWQINLSDLDRVTVLPLCATIDTIRPQLAVHSGLRLVNSPISETLLRVGDKTMRRILFAIATVASSTSFAVAADFHAPIYKAPVMAPVMSWTGFYAGLNGGYISGHQSVDPTVLSEACDNPLGCPQILALLSTGWKISPNSFTGGLQFGYNQQYGNVFFGLESDFDYLRLNGSFAFGPTRTSQQPITGAGAGSLTTSWVATVRPRFGWVADRLLVYVTGGLAFTDQHNRETAIVVVNGQTTGPIGSFDLSSSINIGAVVGAGLEYAWTNQWSVKAEYLHFDFATVRASAGVKVSEALTAPSWVLVGI
jgi:outer membrane immunogenic protein